MTRSLLRAGGPIAVAAGLALGPLLLGAQPAAADTGTSTGAASAPNLGGWNVSADANVVDVVFDNATGLAGIHPVDEADFPEAQSVFETGPFGSGLATVFWPGSAGGNFGSLSGELGVPAQLQPLTSKLNDPARASAEYPAGPSSSSYPAGSPSGAFDMRSDAGATGTSATSDITDHDASGVITFDTARSTSSATAAATADATATSDLTHLSILGIVDIASIQSTASATSDGNSATASAATHLSGVSVLGQKASIGSDGLVVPDLSATPLGPLAADALDQTISALGLEITELPSTEDQQGAADSVTSGGISITIDPPPSAAVTLEQVGALIAPYFPSQAAIIPTLPGLLQGGSLTITIARATASASASPPFDFSFNPPSLAAGSAYGSAGGGQAPGYAATGTGTVPSSAGAPAVTGGSSLPASAPAVAAAASPTTAARPAGGGGLPAALISLSSPLSAGVVAGGLAVAGLLGYGLWRFARLLLAPDSGPACPLGQDNP